MSRKLLKASVLFTVLSIGASALNFAFYPAMSHLLALSDFGDVQIGVSFVMLAAALFTSLSTLALYAAANSAKEGDQAFIGHIERLVISMSFSLVVLTVVFATHISQALRLGDSSLLYILAVIFLINIPAATWIGTLQGTGKFIESGIISISAAAIKILTAVVFVLFGLGAHGALLGIAIGSLIILPLAKLFDTSDQINYRESFSIVKKEDVLFFIHQKSVLFILISLIIIATIGSFDVIAAKSKLLPDDAGGFAQLSTAAKIPYFATLPLAIILFERLVKKSIKRRHATTLFVLVNIGIAFMTWLFSPLVLRIFFNHQSSITPPEFKVLLAAFTLFSIVTFVAYRLIAEKKAITLLSSSFIGCTLVLLLLFNNAVATVAQIANAYLAGIGLVLFIMIALRYTVGYERKEA